MMVRHESRTWSKEDHAKLICLISEGKSEKEMAKALGRSEGAICVRVKLIKSGKTINFRTSPPKPKRVPIELTLPCLPKEGQCF